MPQCKLLLTKWTHGEHHPIEILPFLKSFEISQEQTSEKTVKLNQMLLFWWCTATVAVSIPLKVLQQAWPPDCWRSFVLWQQTPAKIRCKKESTVT